MFFQEGVLFGDHYRELSERGQSAGKTDSASRCSHGREGELVSLTFWAYLNLKVFDSFKKFYDGQRRERCLFSLFLVKPVSVLCIITPLPPLFLTPLSDEGWAECKVRPPCSEKDYFQIHTACDSEGKVSSIHTFSTSHTHKHTYPHRVTAQGRHTYLQTRPLSHEV